jgi:hypothetical protein
MMNPLLAALRDLGGSGSISEINETTDYCRTHRFGPAALGG